MFSIEFHKRQVILLFVVIILSVVARQVKTDRIRARCEKPDYIPNGSFRLRRERVMRIICNFGYQLQGPKTLECIRGKWDGEKPICAKKGCQKAIEQPENGRILIENEVKAILYCSDNYSLAGNRYSYCNGTEWDRPIGNCRVRKNVIQHDCDFETDDICGWTYEPRDGLEWKRVMAANVFTTFKTGPRHDHTTLTANGGHYMLMESLMRQNTPVTLTSPIYERELSLKTACCFQFHYFMYGAGVGDLFVVVKPVSLSLDQLLQTRPEFIKFQKYGNQNNIWNEYHFNIEELTEDFQIVFVAKSGRGQLSDIAVDDVRLLTGEDCNALDKTHDEDMSTEDDEATTYESLYYMQSCAGRCFDAAGNGILRKLNHLMGLCSCDLDCEDNYTCCPDFKAVCLNALFAESTTVNSNTDEGETTEEILQPFINTTRTTQPTTTTTTDTTTTTSTTPKTTTTIASTIPSTEKTTPITVQTTSTPLTVKTTPTTIKTTPTTVKTTTTTKRTTAVITTKTTPTTTLRTTPTTKRYIPTITTRRTTMRTTPTTTTPTTTTTLRTTAASFKTTKTSIIKTNTTVPTTKVTTFAKVISSTQKSTPQSKSTEYIIDNKSKIEAGHLGSSLLLYTFIIIVIIILVGTVYRRFGDSAVAWYMIHFDKNTSGDEETSSITTSFKRPPSNGEVDRSSKTKSRKKGKKSPYSNDMKSPLVDVDDEDDDDIGDNGNIALRDNIYTEL